MNQSPPMSFFPPLFQKNFFIPPIMPSFTRPMPLLMVSLVRWNVFSFFIWEVIQSTYSKILRRIYKNSWSFYQEFFKTSYIVFVSCRKSNYLEQPATSRNKPEWARTTSNNLEQAKCQNVKMSKCQFGRNKTIKLSSGSSPKTFASEIPFF